MVSSSKANTVERRIYKRFETDLPVIVQSDDGEQLEFRATNLSLAGMELRSDRWNVTRVVPKGEKLTPDQSPVVRTQLELPQADGGNRKIVIDCRIALVRRVSEQEYYLHMQYEFFQGNGFDELEQFVDETLAAILETSGN